MSAGRISGVLQVDGYAGFERLTASGAVELAACWAHVRRKFYEFHEGTGSPIAAEALRRIAALYAVEERIRSRSAEGRRTARREARPLVQEMRLWFEQELGRVPPHSTLAETFRYALARWPALCRFLDDGRIELDNNSSRLQLGKQRAFDLFFIEDRFAQALEGAAPIE